MSWLSSGLRSPNSKGTCDLRVASTIKAHRDDLFEVSHKDRLLPSGC